MSFNLINKSGESFNVSGGHWAVYLHLAQSFSWVPKGTVASENYESNQEWSGKYDTNDSQVVTEEDALKLAGHLNAAARHPKIEMILSEIISQIESLVEKQGYNIPQQMRMKPSDFYSEFSPLLIFLYKGSFSIN